MLGPGTRPGTLSQVKAKGGPGAALALGRCGHLALMASVSVVSHGGAERGWCPAWTGERMNGVGPLLPHVPAESCCLWGVCEL